MLLQAIGLALTAGQEIGQTSRSRKQGRIQAGFMQNALKDLALPTLESERALESVSESGQKTIQQVGEKQDQISQSTEFANMSMDDDMIKDVRKEFKRKREDIDISLTKSLSDVLSQFEQQKFEMKSQRQQLEMQKRMAQQQEGTKYFGIL